MKFFSSIVVISISFQLLSIRSKVLSDKVRSLLEKEKVPNVEEFISFHPVLSQLEHFDLHDFDIIKGRELKDKILLDKLDYSFQHADQIVELSLEREILHGEEGIPHFIYHPDQNIDDNSNPYGRKLSEEYSVEYMKVNCMYRGHIKDKSSHKAVISFCNDEIRGVIQLLDEDNELHIQPIELNNKRILVSWYKDSVIESERTCGTESSGRGFDFGNTADEATSLTGGGSSLRQSSSRIDIFVVNDKARTDRYTTVGIFSQTLFTILLVNELYSGFPGSNSIDIQTVGILSMTVTDPWNVVVEQGSDSVQVNDDEGLLNSFGTFMNTVKDELRDPDGGIIDSDVNHLLSGEDFFSRSGTTINQGVVGLANVGVVCAGASSAIGTTQDLFIDDNTATVMAHEIGHNLGFEHTDEPINGNSDSACIEGNIQRIMDPSGTTAKSWSSCSSFWWQRELNSNPDCVSDSEALVPVNAPYCGNGVVDEGEECDCGLTDCGLFDPCCNGATCEYVGGATCASDDLCCNVTSCQFAELGVVCREKRDLSSCDTQEVCTGLSKDCPEDVLANFGSDCSIDGFSDGNCFRGECISAGKQCSEVGLTNACSTSGDGNNFCQGLAASGINCQGAQSSCFAVSFAQISPTDGTECDNGKGCFGGLCVEYSDIPLLDFCFNFELDDNETDVDCGGPDCLPCVEGKFCIEDNDCFGLCIGEDSTCVGDSVIDDEDIFDVIGRFFGENPFFAALFYICLFLCCGYFVYNDIRTRMKTNKKRKEVGGARQETYRQSVRHSQAYGGGIGLASEAEARMEENIPQRNSAGRMSRPRESMSNVSPNPRYRASTGNRNRKSSAGSAGSAAMVPIATMADELPHFDDEIEGKL